MACCWYVLRFHIICLSLPSGQRFCDQNVESQERTFAVIHLIWGVFILKIGWDYKETHFSSQLKQINLHCQNASPIIQAFLQTVLHTSPTSNLPDPQTIGSRFDLKIQAAGSWLSYRHGYRFSFRCRLLNFGQATSQSNTSYKSGTWKFIGLLNLNVNGTRYKGERLSKLTIPGQWVMISSLELSQLRIWGVPVHRRL